MSPWHDKIFGENGPDELDIFEGFEDIIGSALSFLVFVSVFSWVSEKLKQLFRTDYTLKTQSANYPFHVREDLGNLDAGR